MTALGSMPSSLEQLHAARGIFPSLEVPASGHFYFSKYGCLSDRLCDYYRSHGITPCGRSVYELCFFVDSELVTKWD
jgi:hypothetical protein